ncbi:hypothetical protein CDV31_013198 [Fusarium ambrosium]|uniref:Glycosyl transferase family 17 protein n=1 Tax=Fusarium ambrosium TaxID=131363 RepID=A0A428T538_9HYPO|nr:hypothetical protein CDV31_013198 [Fusarium ambrosium]
MRFFPVRRATTKALIILTFLVLFVLFFLPTAPVHFEDARSFLPFSEAVEFCGDLRWNVYPHRRNHRKIYDLVLASSELDWLEIRINELHHHVDYFVIVESTHTFTGSDKPLHVKESLGSFDKFRHQIIHHVLVDENLEFNTTWDREEFQRNAMFDQVFPKLAGPQKPNHGDVIMVSDMDEIPRPSTLIVLRNCDFPRLLTLSSQLYYYSFEWLHKGPAWPHPQATFYDGDQTIRPVPLRDIGQWDTKTPPDAIIMNSAWHCSSCFPKVNDVVNKIQSFSHTEYNKPQFVDRSEIVRRVRQGLDLFDRESEKYHHVPGNKDLPEYIQANPDQFGYLLSRQQPNANFEDYVVT